MLETDWHTQTERQTDRQRQTETEREKDRDTEREGQRQTDRDTQRHTDRDRDGGRLSVYFKPAVNSNKLVGAEQRSTQSPLWCWTWALLSCTWGSGSDSCSTCSCRTCAQLWWPRTERTWIWPSRGFWCSEKTSHRICCFKMVRSAFTSSSPPRYTDLSV